jgi:hypothetical protein
MCAMYASEAPKLAREHRGLPAPGIPKDPNFLAKVDKSSTSNAVCREVELPV